MEALVKATPNSLIEYNLTDAAIQALDEKYQNLAITNSAGYKAVVVGISEIRGYRVQVEAKRKELKREALEFGRTVDGEAKRITALLWPIENQLTKVKQVEDERKSAIKAKKAYRRVPGGPYLNIPTAYNKTPAGVMRIPPKEVFKQGGIVLKTKAGNYGVFLRGRMLFVLKRSVILKPRLGMRTAAENQIPTVLSKIKDLIGTDK